MISINLTNPNVYETYLSNNSLRLSNEVATILSPPRALARHKAKEKFPSPTSKIRWRWVYRPRAKVRPVAEEFRVILLMSEKTFDLMPRGLAVITGVRVSVNLCLSLRCMRNFLLTFFPFRPIAHYWIFCATNSSRELVKQIYLVHS